MLDGCAMVVEAKDPLPDDIYLTPEEVAQRHRTTVESLGNQRYRGEGLPFTKMTGKILYRMRDVLEAERVGSRGFTWQRVANALDAYPHLPAAEADKLLEHLKLALKDG